jgi:tripartite-type tricarboxylate transporter receptor subunit TctC
MHRRTFHSALAGAVIGPWIGASHAQSSSDYPNKPVRIIVGYPPGQTIDLGARVIAKSLSQELGQNVWVENKAGANGIIAHQLMKEVVPDGYTLLMSSSATLAINPTLYRKLPYDPLVDFTPIALVNESPLIMVTGTQSKFATVRDLVNFAKANPGKLTYGSTGSGATGHIAMEMFKKAAGIEMVHVPYKGSSTMLPELINNAIDLAFDAPGSTAPLIKGGKLRAIALSSAARSPHFPGVPTVAESGYPGFQANTWGALLGPAGLPQSILEKLNSAVNRCLKSAAVKEHYTNVGSTLTGGSSSDLAKTMREEIDRWGQAIRLSGAKVD